MTFLSGGFLLLVGALLIIYYVLPKRFRYLVLLGGSVVFYTLAGRAYLPFLGIIVLTVYAPPCSWAEAWSGRKPMWRSIRRS